MWSSPPSPPPPLLLQVIDWLSLPFIAHGMKLNPSRSCKPWLLPAPSLAPPPFLYCSGTGCLSDPPMCTCPLLPPSDPLPGLSPFFPSSLKINIFTPDLSSDITSLTSLSQPLGLTDFLATCSLNLVISFHIINQSECLHISLTDYLINVILPSKLHIAWEWGRACFACHYILRA